MVLALLATVLARLLGASTRSTLLVATGGAALAVPAALFRQTALADTLLVMALGIVAGTLATTFRLPVVRVRIPRVTMPSWRIRLPAWRPRGARATIRVRIDLVLVGYVALAVVAAWPLLRGPYPFALDMIFGPQADGIERLLGRGTFEGPGILLHAAYDFVGPTGLAGRLAAAVIVAGLAAMGYGMHRVVPAGPWGRAFAGVLYVVNPFVYVRLLAGQWLFVLSLAAIPPAIALSARLAREGPSWRLAALLAAIMLLAFAQPHVGVFTMGLCGAVALAHSPRRALVSVGTLSAAALTANAFWILPILLGGSPVISGLAPEDVDAFAPRAHTRAGLGFDLLSLSGFWREGFVLPSDLVPVWPLATTALVFLSVLGYLSARGDPTARAVAIAGVLGYLLSFGPKAPWGGVFVWLTESVPPLRAFRDAQKFLVLLLVAYCWLGSLGVSRLVRLSPSFSARHATALGVALLLVPLASGYPLVAGHSGQTTSVDYPPEWYEARGVLRAAEGRVATLILPWHLYMDFSFMPPAQPRLANPAASFFDGPVLQGDNPELGGSGGTDPVSRLVQSALQDGAGIGVAGDHREDFALVVSAVGVTHIVLLKESDWTRYRAFLDAQPDLVVRHENARAVVYESLVPAGRLFATRATIDAGIENVTEATRVRPLNTVYAAEGAPRAPGPGGPVPADENVLRVSPARAVDDRIVMLAVVQGEAGTWAWEGDEKVPPMLGFIPAGRADGHFKNERLVDVLIPSYAATLLALALIMTLAWREGRRA